MSICNQILELSVAGKIIIKEIRDRGNTNFVDTVSGGVCEEDPDVESGDVVVNAVYAAPNYYTELNSARLLNELNIDFRKQS